MLSQKILICLILYVLTLSTGSAQHTKIDDDFYKSRVLKAPESVFKMFVDAGMTPTNHVLTAAEQSKVDEAFSILPPLYKTILKEHLQSISFMDNMPNTALTSTLETADASQQFNITFRAGILHETISEWATWKEKSAFNFKDSPTMHIEIDAGKLDAIQYVLLHEATHVVDAVLKFSPNAEKEDSLVAHTAFTKNIWHLYNVPDAKFINPLLENTRFRSGKVQAIADAPAIYHALKKTPFSSLYAMASWYEDAAELITIYHLTQKLHQPFVIYVKDNHEVVAKYEPMKNHRVKRRVKKLGFIYETKSV